MFKDVKPTFFFPSLYIIEGHIGSYVYMTAITTSYTFRAMIFIAIAVYFFHSFAFSFVSLTGFST